MKKGEEKNTTNDQKEKDKAECQKCIELGKLCQEMEENWKRSIADFVNYKKRSEEEKKAILNIAKAEVVLSFLPLYDSLRRAVESSELNQDGLQKVMQMFDVILKKYEIEKIEAGVEFDPKWCEAVGFKEGNKDNNGQIAEVVESGFKSGEQLIKPARVLLYKV
ncbi:MAG TPA: nucleotide exchange factor GrpE [bacterium]|nr:nucleotide exchange factor GrpE [bacterium]HPN67263.1 nucleotide exchange factor GrpE [bacterium]